MLDTMQDLAWEGAALLIVDDELLLRKRLTAEFLRVVDAHKAKAAGLFEKRLWEFSFLIQLKGQIRIKLFFSNPFRCLLDIFLGIGQFELHVCSSTAHWLLWLFN